MDHNQQDQERRKLQDHVVQILSKYLSNSMDLIEYKPRHPVYLLSMSKNDRKGHPEALQTE